MAIIKLFCANAGRFRATNEFFFLSFPCQRLSDVDRAFVRQTTILSRSKASGCYYAIQNYRIAQRFDARYLFRDRWFGSSINLENLSERLGKSVATKRGSGHSFGARRVTNSLDLSQYLPRGSPNRKKSRVSQNLPLAISGMLGEIEEIRRRFEISRIHSLPPLETGDRQSERLI